MLLYFFPHSTTGPVLPELPIIEASRSNSVGLLWTRDQSDAETSIWQRTTHNRYIHASDGIRTYNFRKWKAADSHLRSRGH